MILFWYWLYIIALVRTLPTTLDDKYHVLIVNIPSRGRSNQLFAIAEELITSENKNHFVTFVVNTASVRFLDEFIARYPLEDNKNNYQILTAPDVANTVTDPGVNFIELIKVYIWLITSPLHNIYPLLHQYLEATGHYHMTTRIDDYSRYNMSSWNDNQIILKPIDVVLSDILNTAPFVLTKIYHIPTVALNTMYYSSHESRWHLSDAPIVFSRPMMEGLPNYPHFTYIQSIKTKVERFILSSPVQWYILSKVNAILCDELNITHPMLPARDGAVLFSESLILKSMGPPVSIRDTFTSQRSQNTGFLVPKHLYESEPWLNPITVKLFEPFGYKDLIEWIDDTDNTIY
eukprot:981868_1